MTQNIGIDKMAESGATFGVQQQPTRAGGDSDGLYEIDTVRAHATAITDTDADDYDEQLEEMNILLVLLKRAYADKDWVQADAIVETMVTKSHVVGLQPLHTACGYGLVELVENYLAEKTCDPNAECSFNGLTGITPIHFCAGIGPEPISEDRDKCIELLVKHGARVNQLTSRNDTPLHWATKLADYKVLTYFKLV